MIKTVGLLFVLCCELFSNINNQPNTLQLLDSEKELLWDKKAITICSEQKSPYIIDNTDPLEGIIIDMLKEFESILGIPFKVIRAKKQGDCQKKIDKNEVDFMTMLKINASHANEDITKWYLGDFFVITTAYDKPYIDDLSNIKHMKISVNEEFKNFINQLKVDYPTINFVLVKNTQEGLRGVIYEDFYAHIDLHKTMAWLIQHKYLGEVKVSGTLQFYNVKNVLHVSNSDDSDILLNILNKTIKQFDPQLKREIENSWISIVYEKGFDYKMLMQIMIVFIAVLFVALYFHYQLKKQVQKHIEQNKTQQALLFQQSKLASMGEMINNIAHQWRQPLNRINSSAAVIYTFGDKSIQQKVKDIENNTRYMSDTIEDFSNFFHPDKEKVEFDLDQALQKAMNLLNSRLNNVQLNIDNKNTMMLYGYEKEYIQVLLTILNNALDNFEINDIQNPRIAIDVKKNNHSIEVHIEDNGGGIKEEIIGKIFDPYFTTKFSSQGKGIGLYMSKMICENSMDGELNVSNGEHGAIFTIMLRVQVLK